MYVFTNDTTTNPLPNTRNPVCRKNQNSDGPNPGAVVTTPSSAGTPNAGIFGAVDGATEGETAAARGANTTKPSTPAAKNNHTSSRCSATVTAQAPIATAHAT